MKYNVKHKMKSISYWILKKIGIPIFELTSKIFGVKKERINKLYIYFNNKYVKSKQYNCKNDNVVLLLPHCLQNHECKIRITTDITNCKKCGKCDISKLIELSQRLGVKAFIVTGGTAAREKLKKIKPSAVVAVACDRDLSSGIKDMNKIPILGVENVRPNGPCYDTHVDIDKVEKAIKFFIEEKVFEKIISVY